MKSTVLVDLHSVGANHKLFNEGFINLINRYTDLRAIYLYKSSFLELELESLSCSLNNPFEFNNKYINFIYSSVILIKILLTNNNVIVYNANPIHHLVCSLFSWFKKDIYIVLHGELDIYLSSLNGQINKSFTFFLLSLSFTLYSRVCYIFLSKGIQDRVLLSKLWKPETHTFIDHPFIPESNSPKKELNENLVISHVGRLCRWPKYTHYFIKMIEKMMMDSDNNSQLEFNIVGRVSSCVREDLESLDKKYSSVNLVYSDSSLPSYIINDILNKTNILVSFSDSGYRYRASGNLFDALKYGCTLYSVGNIYINDYAKIIPNIVKSFSKIEDMTSYIEKPVNNASFDVKELSSVFYSKNTIVNLLNKL